MGRLSHHPERRPIKHQAIITKRTIKKRLDELVDRMDMLESRIKLLEEEADKICRK